MGNLGTKLLYCLLVSLVSVEAMGMKNQVSCPEVLLLVEPNRVREATAQVIFLWQQSKKPLPIFFSNEETSIDSFISEDEIWLTEKIGSPSPSAKKVKTFLTGLQSQIPKYGSKSHPAVRNKPPIFVFEGQKRIFRPLGDNENLEISKVRRTLAISRMNSFMEIDTTAPAHLAIVLDEFGPEFGVVSDFIEGSTDILSVSSDRSISNAQAFEFLFSNTDVFLDNPNGLNHIVRPDGSICIIDHDCAILGGFPVIHSKDRFMGSSLPQKYTKKFIKALELLSVETIEKIAGPLLTQNEIRAILFNKDIILQDLKIMGEEGIFKE